MARRIKPIGVKLPNFQRLSAYLFFSLVAITGVWWIMLSEVMASMNLKLIHQVLIIHGITATICLMIFGSIMTQHIRIAWQLNKNRVSGGASATVFVLLILTGLGLYYAGEEQQSFFEWSHIAVGLLIVFLVPVHIVLGKRAH
ncbi:MAG: hypothetical protein ACO29L_00945 [Candidatus Methylopumilus sp.]